MIRCKRIANFCSSPRPTIHLPASHPHLPQHRDLPSLCLCPSHTHTHTHTHIEHPDAPQQSTVEETDAHSLLDLRKDVAVVEQEVLLHTHAASATHASTSTTPTPGHRNTHLVAHLDRAATEPGYEHPVARLHADGLHVPVPIRSTRAGRDDGRLRDGVARRRRGEEDPACGFL